MNFYQKPPWEFPGIRDGIVTIDSHTAGEFTRLIVAGAGEIQGDTMTARREFFINHCDHIRQLLTKEPRGHRDVFAAALTKPATKEARFGLIYMDARRYPFLCGHATIGAVATLARTGFLTLREGENCIPVDTPSGTLYATASVNQGKLQAVAINMVPSFVLETGRAIHVPDYGTLHIDIVCVGGVFAMVSSQEIKIEPTLANSQRLATLGMRIIRAANEQANVFHPERPEVNSVDVAEFYDAPDEHDSRMEGKGIVVYGEAHVDRSPCGTGTAAKLTLLRHRGTLGLNQTYTNYGPLGTSFEAKLVRQLKVGSLDAVVAQIKGMAHVTGFHTFILEDDDPFPQGFLL